MPDSRLAAEYLSGRLLLAMPGMVDKRFDHAVIALCVHDEHGALGIGIGHARDNITFHALLRDLDIDPGKAPDCAIHHGGPVEPARGFVLHSSDWGGGDTIAVNPLCSLSASQDILRAIAEGRGPTQWLVALGYAGWGPSQLDSEMRHHGWYAAQGRPSILFDTPMQRRWTATWKGEGIDPALLSSVTGRA
jgi:putative transcriptional regulator